jgi:hypothetical protein
MPHPVAEHALAYFDSLFPLEQDNADQSNTDEAASSSIGIITPR